jgi:hypothetical protein
MTSSAKLEVNVLRVSTKQDGAKAETIPQWIRSVPEEVVLHGGSRGRGTNRDRQYFQRQPVLPIADGSVKLY